MVFNFNMQHCFTALYFSWQSCPLAYSTYVLNTHCLMKQVTIFIEPQKHIVHEKAETNIVI